MPRRSSIEQLRCLPTLFRLEKTVPLTPTETLNSPNQALDLPGLAPWLRRKCLTTLCRICGKLGLLPIPLLIPQCYDRQGTPPAKGGFSEVWKGNHQDRQVAVKVLSIYTSTDLVKVKLVGRRFGVVPALVN